MPLRPKKSAFDIVVSDLETKARAASAEGKRFANKVSNISSPGYLEGGNVRERYGFVGSGPSAITTELDNLRPDPLSKEFILDGYYSFSRIEKIRRKTGWTLKVSPDVHAIDEPTPEEPAALHLADQNGALRKQT